MSSAVKAGRSNFLYYNSGVSYAVPTWSVIDRIGDLNRNNTKQSTDVDMRASPTTIKVFGNKSRQLTFTLYKKAGNADVVYNALLESYENDKMMDMVISETSIAAAVAAVDIYDRGPFTVGEMTKAEPIAGVDAFNVTMDVVDAVQSPGTTPFVYQANKVHPIAP